MTDGEGSQPQQTPSTGQTPPAGPTPPATETAANGDKSPEDMTVGELVFEVSDQRLGPDPRGDRARQDRGHGEVQQPASRLDRGAGRRDLRPARSGACMHGFAWLLNDLVFDNPWAGFFVEAGIFLLIGSPEASSPIAPSRALRRRRPTWRSRRPRRSRLPSRDRTDRRIHHEHAHGPDPWNPRQRAPGHAPARHSLRRPDPERHRPAAPGVLALGRRAAEPLGPGDRREAADQRAPHGARRRRRRGRLPDRWGDRASCEGRR